MPRSTCQWIERARFLGEACAGDAELLREVEDLLAADGKQGEGILAAIEGEAQSCSVRKGWWARASALTAWWAKSAAAG